MESRRRFIKTASVAVAGGLLAGPRLFAAESDPLGPVLPQRILGRSGEKVTAFGMGGFHLGKAGSPAAAQGMIDRAIEIGVRFFDTARAYERGGSEELYGQFLTPRYRDHIFLMTKTASKDGASVQRDLESSLAALKTDRLDLWQMHDMHDPGDVDRRINSGVLDVVLKAKADGKTRYVGFSGHTNPKTHLYFLEKLKERGVEFDTVQMPVNLCDPHFESFQANVLPVLIDRKYGVLAMKTMAGGSMMGRLIDTTPPEIAAMGIPQVNREANLSLADMHRYVYSQPVSVLISGCETVPQLEENVQVLRDYQPLTKDEIAKLLDATKPYAGVVVENYKRVF